MPDLKKILFLDIETAPQTAHWSELDSVWANLWEEKVSLMRRRIPERYGEDCTGESKYQEAGIFAEFGRVVCISIGYLYEVDGVRHLKEKSFCGEDEKALLESFAELLRTSCQTREHFLCGHNVKEFDIPFIARRMVVHAIPLPEILQVMGKKPWETRFLDTMEMWKFGDYKHYTSLKLMCQVLGIHSPKEEIDGSQVAQVFYEERDLPRIVRYCERDVLATVQLYLRMVGEKMVDETDVIHSDA